MSVIEIRPYRNGWKVFEVPGVEPVFLEKRQAINYAETRASFRSGEIRILDSAGKLLLPARRGEFHCSPSTDTRLEIFRLS
jgi:hypothetical protein